MKDMLRSTLEKRDINDLQRLIVMHCFVTVTSNEKVEEEHLSQTLQKLLSNATLPAR